jgi:hypothetical protein
LNCLDAQLRQADWLSVFRSLRLLSCQLADLLLAASRA